jgi:hypothetical protein
MKIKVLAVFVLFMLTGCDKNDDIQNNSDFGIEFYLLKEYKTEENVCRCKIIENTVKIEHEPLIKYSDIISYNKNTYTFIISDSIILYDPREYCPLLKKAFAVTIDKEVIYTGYFWSGFSSLGCNWIIVDLLKYYWKNEFIVELGYPGIIIGDTIPDKRNDPRILEVLRNDNKLIE